MNSDIESLMSQYLDGRMSAHEAAELSRLLIENPEAAARFAELTRVDEGLRVALKAESRSEIFAARLRSKSKAENETAKTSGPDRRRWLAAAAGLAVMGGTAWWFTRDHNVPAMVMDWAKSRVKRNAGGTGNGDDSGSLSPDGFHASLPVDEAAALRRKLRNFAIPYLHLRSMPVSDALNTLALQWTSLPHVKAEDAEKVKISLADSARKRWPTTDKEPVVSVDMPNLSLHTALNLIAAQAGLKVDVAAGSITLLPDESSARAKAVTLASAEVAPKPEELKTWTFPLTKPVADTFLTSLNQRQQQEDPAAVIAGQADGLTWTGRPHYNFSYAWQKSPAVTIAGVAGPGLVPASGSPQANLELSFRVADVAAEIPQTIQDHETAVLNDTAALLTLRAAAVPAAAENREGVLDPAAAGTEMMDMVSVESTLQEASAPQLPSLSGAGDGSLVENRAEIVHFDINAQNLQAVPDADGAQSVAAGRTQDYDPAQNSAAGQSTVMGVGTAASTDALYGFSAAPPPSSPAAGGAANVSGKLLKAEVTALGELNDDWLLARQAATPEGGASAVVPGKPVLLNSARFVNIPPEVQEVTWFVKPGPPTLDAWLTGLSGGGSTAHDTENNLLSVTGTVPELRTAAAAVAALTESVQWGVSLDARYLELGDLPLPEINHAGGSPSLSADEVEKLCKAANSTPGSACVRLPLTPGPLEKPIRLSIGNGTAQTMADGISSMQERKLKVVLGDAPGTPQLFLDASVTAAKQGERWTLTTGLKEAGAELNNKASLMDGSWLVIESSKGHCLLLRPRSASVTP